MAAPAITERPVAAPLCRLDDLADGHSRGFDPLGEGRDTMFVVRQGCQVFAWRNACPHFDHARMAWKRHEFLTGDRARIVCGAHGAQFEIDSGVCVIGPCLGQRLTPVPVETRGGELFVLGPYAPGLRPRVGRHHA